MGVEVAGEVDEMLVEVGSSGGAAMLIATVVAILGQGAELLFLKWGPYMEFMDGCGIAHVVGVVLRLPGGSVWRVYRDGVLRPVYVPGWTLAEGCSREVEWGVTC